MIDGTFIVSNGWLRIDVLVDEQGLNTLEAVLGHYAEILELSAPPQPVLRIEPPSVEPV